MDPPPGRQLPRTIGRYRVLERLGKGAMGIVYRAYDDMMERPVAIKVMMADLQDDPETSARFRREALAAGRLVHRNIITIFDMGQDDGRPYIVMELFEGRTLAEYLQRAEPVAVEDKISLMMQVCDGLQLAHVNGIFHRDIKPGNLLIREDGTLKIVDFGIARLATSSMTVSGLIVGTPDYMSPEQARGQEVDERSDIFSAGAVFYLMLTGRKPFAAANLPAVLSKVQNDDPLPVRQLEAPPGLAAVVLKALEKSPAARYQNFGALMGDLARVSREIAAETKRMVGHAFEHLATTEQLAADSSRLCRELGVTAVSAEFEQFTQRIHQRYPAIGDWRRDDSGVSLRHADACDLLEQARATRDRLEAEIVVLRRVDEDLRRGARAASAGNLKEALVHFDAAGAALPASRRARSEATRVRGLLVQQQAAEDRARALVAEAGNAADRADWAAVLALTEEALAADASNEAARELCDRARTELGAEARQRRLQCQQALARAEKLLRKGRFDAAEESLQEAKRLDPQSPIASALEERIHSARLDAMRASERERQAADAIAAARTKFGAGARDQAIEDLRTFVAVNPDSAAVSVALEKLLAEADRLATSERRHAEAMEHAKAAEAALQRDDPDRAIELARRALHLDPGEPLARTVQGMAAARLEQRAAAEKRKDAARRAMLSARDLLARGKHAAARDRARSAASLTPDDEEPAALLVEIDEREAKAREAKLREQEARDRAKSAAPVLAMAKAAEKRREFVPAGWLAENALALDPECAEARELLDRVRTILSSHPEFADDTVNAGSDDTLPLGLAMPVWQRLLESLKNWWQSGTTP